MVVHFPVRCKACTILALIVLSTTAWPQGFLDIQARNALEKRIAGSIVEVILTYTPEGMQDPTFKQHGRFLGVVIAAHKVVTTSIATKSRVQSVKVVSLDGKQHVRCTLSMTSQDTGVVVMDCPTLPLKPATVARVNPKTGSALYSVQKEGSFITLIQGLYKSKAPAPLKYVFFVAGLDNPGLPLFDYKGRAVGLVIRHGIPIQNRIGVAAPLSRVLDEIHRSKNKGTGKGHHKSAQTGQSG